MTKNEYDVPATSTSARAARMASAFSVGVPAPPSANGIASARSEQWKPLIFFGERRNSERLYLMRLNSAPTSKTITRKRSHA
ncbi:MAG: hypothetical protein L6V83_04680 [Christensenella sp.]|nr:MAG: hypothetical protein L6V83_04680 [Christensenella sp.]